MFGRTLLVMEVVNQQHRLRHFEAQVVKCRDVEALQDLAIRLFAENQGRSALYEDLLAGLTLAE